MDLSRRMIWVFWPAFIVGGLMTAVTWSMPNLPRFDTQKELPL